MYWVCTANVSSQVFFLIKAVKQCQKGNIGVTLLSSCQNFVFLNVTLWVFICHFVIGEVKLNLPSCNNVQIAWVWNNVRENASFRWRLHVSHNHTYAVIPWTWSRITLFFGKWPAMEEKLFHVDTWIRIKIQPYQVLLETILHELSSLAMISTSYYVWILPCSNQLMSRLTTDNIAINFKKVFKKIHIFDMFCLWHSQGETIN